MKMLLSLSMMAGVLAMGFAPTTASAEGWRGCRSVKVCNWHNGHRHCHWERICRHHH